MAIYNNIGKTYNETRKADKRILSKIIESLKLNNSGALIDVGAGTGNYSNELINFTDEVVAVEPSIEMINQGKKNNEVIWVKGSAEEIDQNSEKFDYCICILSTHHFKDLEKSLKEIYRVLVKGGKLLIYTFIPSESEKFWLEDYFPEVFEIDRGKFLTITEWSELFNALELNNMQIEEFLLPRNLDDNFLASNWSKPEEYLKKEVIDGISTFFYISESSVISGQQRLKKDLENGVFYKKYKNLDKLKNFDAGYRFLLCQK